MTENKNPPAEQEGAAGKKAQTASAKKETPKRSAELEALKKKLSESEDEIKRTNDMLLRTAAEYDNFRKRTAKEKAELFTSVAADTVARLLPVIDSLELALSSEGSDPEKLRSGLELTAKQLSKSLADIGVTEIEADQFDPKLHDAVMHIEDDGLPENSVAEVLRKGYKLGDTVIRPATVKVAN